MKVSPNPLPTTVAHPPTKIRIQALERTSRTPQNTQSTRPISGISICYMVLSPQEIINLAQCKERYQNGPDLAPHIEHMIEKMREDAEKINSALQSRQRFQNTVRLLKTLHNRVTTLRHADTEEKATATLKVTQSALEAASNICRVDYEG